jgi:transcriptional regulator with XRE-family HTH domain
VLDSGQPTKGQLQSAFGQTVRKLRLKTGMSQELLARELAIDRGYLAATERGRHNPTLYTFSRLLAGLRVTMTEFAVEFDRNLRSSNR